MYMKLFFFFGNAPSPTHIYLLHVDFNSIGRFKDVQTGTLLECTAHSLLEQRPLGVVRCTAEEAEHHPGHSIIKSTSDRIQSSVYEYAQKLKYGDDNISSGPHAMQMSLSKVPRTQGHDRCWRVSGGIIRLPEATLAMHGGLLLR